MPIVLEIFSEEDVHGLFDGNFDRTDREALNALAGQDAEVHERLQAYLDQNRHLAALFNRLDPSAPLPNAQTAIASMPDERK